TFPRQGVYGRLTSGTSPDGAAWVVATGRELYEKDVEVTTRYTLRPGDRALLIETTLVNKGMTSVGKLGLGDAIHWGGAEKTAPSGRAVPRGAFRGRYLAGIGRHVSYAITSTDGQIAAVSGSSWSDTEQKKDVALAPGESVQYARVFVVGARPDGMSVLSEIELAEGKEVGAVEIALEGPGGPIAAPAGARAILRNEDGQEASLVASAEERLLTGYAPAGKWVVRYGGGAARVAAPGSASASIDVAPGAVAAATLKVTEPGRVRLTCMERR